MTRLMMICYVTKNKFWEELITYFPLIRHGQQRKRRAQQFYYCVCTCRGNIYTETLPSNDMGIHTGTQTDWRDL
jgi:hypothetical protein